MTSNVFKTEVSVVFASEYVFNFFVKQFFFYQRMRVPKTMSHDVCQRPHFAVKSTAQCFDKELHFCSVIILRKHVKNKSLLLKAFFFSQTLTLKNCSMQNYFFIKYFLTNIMRPKIDKKLLKKKDIHCLTISQAIFFTKLRCVVIYLKQAKTVVYKVHIFIIFFQRQISFVLRPWHLKSIYFSHMLHYVFCQYIMLMHSAYAVGLKK